MTSQAPRSPVADLGDWPSQPASEGLCSCGKKAHPGRDCQPRDTKGGAVK